MALQRGEVVGQQFTLIERLGHGGMGSVWKAQDRNGQVVAIKILHEHLAFDEMFVGRFEREVEVVRRINSENVVRTIGMGRYEGRPFIVMEMVEGQSLRAIIDERGRLPWSEARLIVRQVVLGLITIHGQGVIHRDIKPGNIIVTPGGIAKIVDFGIARADDLTNLTSTNVSMGTPAYMPGDRIQDESGDLFSLGCVAYELCTGSKAFPFASTEDAFLPTRRQANLAALPVLAQPLIGWLLAPNRRDRPKSATAVLGVVDGGMAPRPAEVAQPEPRKSSRSGRVWVSLGFLSVFAAVIVGVLLLMNRESEDPGILAAIGPGVVYTPPAGSNSAEYRVTAFVRSGNELEVHFSIRVHCGAGATALRWTSDVALKNVALYNDNGAPSAIISNGSGAAVDTQSIPCNEVRTGSWYFQMLTGVEPDYLAFPRPEFKVRLPGRDDWRPIAAFFVGEGGFPVADGGCLDDLVKPLVSGSRTQVCLDRRQYGSGGILSADKFSINGVDFVQLRAPVEAWSYQGQIQ